MPLGLEQLAVDAGLGEAGDRVELVDQHLARRRRRSRSARGRCSRRARTPRAPARARAAVASSRSRPGRAAPCRPPRTSPRSRTSRRGRRSRPGPRRSARSGRAASTRPPCRRPSASTITFGSWRRGRLDRGVELVGRADLGDADAGAEPGRLHPERQAEATRRARASPPRRPRRSPPAGCPLRPAARLKASLSMQIAEASTSEPT